MKDSNYLTLAIALVSVGIGSLYYFQSQKKKDITVSDLYIFPIKSCKGIRVSSAKVTKGGLEFDRAFMLIDENNRFLSQRKLPKMALIEPLIYAEKQMLIVKAPEMENLVIPLKPTLSDDSITVSIWGDDCKVRSIQDPKVGAWFDRYLGISGSRLVVMDEGFVRPTDPEFAPKGQTLFSDGFPFLIASKGSLLSINEKLDVPVAMENFRPNIVVDGCDPFAEDSWKKIKFGAGLTSLIANIVKPCARCTVPNVNQSTGERREDNQPTQIMKSFRKGKDLNLPNKKWEGDVSFFFSSM